MITYFFIAPRSFMISAFTSLYQQLTFDYLLIGSNF